MERAYILVSNCAKGLMVGGGKRLPTFLSHNFWTTHSKTPQIFGSVSLVTMCTDLLSLSCLMTTALLQVTRRSACRDPSTAVPRALGHIPSSTLLCQERRAVYCTSNVLYSGVQRLPQLFAYFGCGEYWHNLDNIPHRKLIPYLDWSN